MFVNSLLGITNFPLLIRSEYEGRDQNSVPEIYESRYYSQIVDIIAKADFEYSLSLNHYLRFGAELISHAFDPGSATYRDVIGNREPKIVTETAAGRLPSYEAAIYAEDEVILTEQLRAAVGLRLSGYYARGSWYGGVEPRLTGRYRINPTTTAKASAAWSTQYVHLLSEGALSLPREIWVPTHENIGPQRGYHIAAGMVRILGNDAGYNLTVEGFFKRLKNLLEYKEAAGFGSSVSLVWPDLVESGKGQAIGIEFMLRKRTAP